MSPPSTKRISMSLSSESRHSSITTDDDYRVRRSHTEALYSSSLSSTTVVDPQTSVWTIKQRRLISFALNIIQPVLSGLIRIEEAHANWCSTCRKKDVLYVIQIVAGKAGNIIVSNIMQCETNAE